jgi:PTS system galactitol-specific IIB component
MMRKVKIMVVCAQAAATSTVVKTKVENLCRENKIPCDVSQCRVIEFRSKVQAMNPDLILNTCPVPDTGRPTISAVPYLTGLKIAELEDSIVKHLKNVSSGNNNHSMKEGD